MITERPISRKGSASCSGIAVANDVDTEAVTLAKVYELILRCPIKLRASRRRGSRENVNRRSGETQDEK